LQDQGNLSGAIAAVRRALALGREIKNLPMLGAVLITLASLRLTLAEAMQTMMNLSSRDPFISKRLRRTSATLRRALTLTGPRAEDTAKAHLAQASIYLLQGTLEAAEEIARQTMEIVQQQQHFQLLAYAQRLLGCILSASERYTEADEYFQQALATSRKYDMRLEYARALYSFGVVLLERGRPGEALSQQGLTYLREAYAMFEGCQAAIDLAKVKRILAKQTEGLV
jgi:tetratricopeptide (TPR) repeat protein